MTIHTWISTDFAYRLGLTLMHSLWEGMAIAGVLAVILAALHRRAARARYLVLIIAMLAMVMAFTLTFIIGPEARHSSRLVTGSNLASFIITDSQQNGPPLSPSLPLSSPAKWMIKFSPAAAAFWLVGVSLLAAYRLAGWFAVQRLHTLQVTPADPAILQIAQRLAERLSLARSFRILISHFAQTPMVIGWLRPVILLPVSALTGLSAPQLEGILAHELAHIHRHDYLVNLLQIAAETLMFYHPAVWWMSRQIRLEREQACDDIAISLCNDRYEYARSLAAIEELRFGGTPVLAAAGSCQWQMLARVRRILSPTNDAPRRGLASVLALLMLAGAAEVIYCQSKTHAATTQPFSLRNDADRLSPFTAVRWSGNVAFAVYNNTWYEVGAIDDVPVPKIIDYLEKSNDFAPQKHFAEDLVEVMRGMNHPTGDTVKLSLKTLDTQKEVVIPAAGMTKNNRRQVLMYSSFLDSSAHGRPGDSRSTPPATQHAAAIDPFPFNVPFEQGATQFFDGDIITVTSVKGTAKNMESGICRISGTYTLSSHDTATLAASVTASEAKDGTGNWNAAQHVEIKKGSGTFTLLLPISIRGWPHVSFYNHSDFGSSYIGTGDWVLRQWWDSSK